MLPYSVEVYFASMALYNEAWFPAPLLALLLSTIAMALAVWPLPGRERLGARLIGAVLAVAWLWVGAVHELQLMADLNFMAPIYGGAWIVQGALIALTCAVLGRVRFQASQNLRGRVGLMLALLGLIGYPLAVLALGFEWRALPLVGTAPQPTAIFTAGLLLAVRERPPLHLFILPLAWAGVAAFTAYALRFPLDYAVTAALLLAVALAVRARLRRA